MRGLVLIICLILMVNEMNTSKGKKPTSKWKKNAKNVPVSSFPTLEKLASGMPDISGKYEIKGCRLRLLSGSCLLTVLPEKAHCLTLEAVILALQPQFFLYFASREVNAIRPFRITVFYVNTCLEKVTYVTSAEGRLDLLPRLITLQPVVAELSIPIPLGDYEMTSRGTWQLDDYQMTVKIMKEDVNEYSLSGSMKNPVPVRTIARKFDLDVLPTGGLKVLLEGLGVENFIIHQIKLNGRVDLSANDYELVFSGVPEIKGLTDVHVKVFIIKKESYVSLSLLFEFQDYSPVTLLQRMYGPSITHMNLLRDRNQTLALFITSAPVSNFSHAIISHGSSRWIHRDSKFQKGATLLVTLPFPRRKAVDMKLQLYADGLGFDLPEGESLPADLALGAISPNEIIHIDKNTHASLNHLQTDDKKLGDIKILRFRYFLFNDTYIAAASQLENFQMELESLMPKSENTVTKNTPTLLNTGNARKLTMLDMFFKRSDPKEASKRGTKNRRNLIHKMNNKRQNRFERND